MDAAEERERREWLERKFPGVRGTSYVITSEPTEDYNCIAHAAGESHRRWWPRAPDYWPPATPMAETLEAFITAFGARGYYLRTASSDLETGFEKVAIFTKKGRPTHAARQLPSGVWSSKLGDGLDLSHALKAIEGGLYGQVACILRRPAADKPAGDATDAGG